MDVIINKFNEYLDRYYDEVLMELEVMTKLKKFLFSMDIKALYSLLDSKSKMITDEFKNTLRNLIELTSKDKIDYKEYDLLIAKLISLPIFLDVQQKERYLLEQKENYELHLFDYSFITKFMLDNGFSISEINVVLTNYKPNKKDFSFNGDLNESLNEIELPKLSNSLKKELFGNHDFIEVNSFINKYRKVYESLINDPKMVDLFSLASNFLVDGTYEYDEPIFITHFISLLNMHKTLMEKLEYCSTSTERNDIYILLSKMKNVVDNLRKMQITPESQEYYEIRFLSEITVPSEVTDKLSIGDFDYKRGINPIKIIGIKDFVVRINTCNNMATSFIEINGVVYILCYDKVDRIINASIDIYNKNKLSIIEMINGVNYGR